MDRPPPTSVLPTHRQLYWGGAWHDPKAGQFAPVEDPASGASLGMAPVAEAEDADAAIAAGRVGFAVWRRVPPLERARIMQEIAAVIRRHGDELALLDAVDGGNPVREMRSD